MTVIDYAETFQLAHPECNAYCRDGKHAMVGWINTRQTNDPRSAAQKVIALHFGEGTELLDMRPAPEAVAPTGLGERDQISELGRQQAVAVKPYEVAYLTIIRLDPMVECAFREMAGRD